MTSRQSTAARILVVEDDRSLAELYANWLDGTYEVETAHDGAEALERLDETIDVVLLDRLMPGLSGGEVLAAIPESAADPQVVVVSAVTPDLDVVQMGFDAYLEKPIDPPMLYETIDRMLTRGEYDAKLQELFSLIERQDALEAVQPPEVLDASEEYRSLVERLETVQADVEALLTELPDEDFRVAVERLQRTVAERRSERRYESLTEDVLDTSREATVVVDADGTVVWANEATETLLGVDRSDVRGREYATVAAEQFETIAAETRATSLASLVRTGLSERDRELDATVHVPADGDRTERWLEYWSAPIETGLYVGGRIEHYHDITGRHARERYLQGLHRATRTLMTADTAEAVAERAVATATAELDLPYAAVFTRTDGTGDLVPTARETTDPDVDPTLPTLSDGSGPIWTAFVTRLDSLEAETHRERDGSGGWLDEAFDDWLVCPLGRQGVVLYATGDDDAFSATQRDLAETWAANTQQALEQIARTRDLRDRDRELRRQNDRLMRLDRINRLIRSITPAVVSANTRTDVEHEVCRRLCRIETVTGAWVADVDLPTDATVSRAAAGDLDRYLADVPAVPMETDAPRAAAPTDPLPARRACETRSSVCVTDLVSVDSDAPWRERGLISGTNTIVAIPITYDSVCFGAVEIHVDRPDGMSDEEVEALEELGRTIGHAIGAIRHRDALLAGGTTNLTFHVASDGALSAFMSAVDTPVASVDLSHRDDGAWAVFVTLDVTDHPDPESLGTRIAAETAASVLSADATTMTCVVTLAADSPIQQLVERGVTLQGVAFRAAPARLRVTVQLPSERDVREYVADVTAALDGVELVAKRDTSVDWETTPTPAVPLDDRLTDRQREVLRMAFHAGYFDWPRDNDATTVATELGIAQSTFSQHLRAAERKLLEEHFG